MRSSTSARLLSLILLACVAGLLYESSLEFYNVAWGTGAWIGEFSLKWALAFGLFVILCVLSLVAIGIAFWPGSLAIAFSARVARQREHLGSARFLLVPLLVIAPIALLQYSPWGVVIDKPGLRLLLWCLFASMTAFVITSHRDRPWTWAGGLTAVLLTGAGFVLAAAFTDVTSYPFSLGWSEGNRLWDYSLMFARGLYSYPPGKAPVAYLDLGRQFVGGLPFLLPHVSILGERLWLAALAVLPYLILGWLVFRPARMDARGPWLLAAVWGFMFLSQGPIHTPLVLCAILVAVALRQSDWLAALLVAVAGYFAGISRFTWIFAPAIWAVMIEVGRASLIGGLVPKASWRRAVVEAVGGLAGSALGILEASTRGGTGQGSVAATSAGQPLLWYRLFPNATYGDGILLGLLVAAGPLTALLILAGLRHWNLSLSQKLSIAPPLLAFLAVGLIVSTKIGGGGDLHNLDMFLIGLLFVAALAWRAVQAHWLMDLQRSPLVLGPALLLLVALPALGPLLAIRPLSFAKDAAWLATLADVGRTRDLGSLPAQDVVAGSLGTLQSAVLDAQRRGEVLFMDQRQLLTFGYLQNVTLVPDFEKKRMMDEALSGDTSYFRELYRDLAGHRFTLIISSPLRTPIQDSEYGFGEENNAWVNWVAKPVLCYYQEQQTLTQVKVELLVPRTEPERCSTPLP
jgi:hypothetical protein